MRRSFAAIVRGAGVDIEAEYRSLRSLLFGDYDFCSEMEYGFDSMPFKGTAISLSDFNRRHGFDFENLSATRGAQKFSKGLESDLFYIANNFNIRHNNTDPDNPEKYREHVVRMQPCKLEELYDELHGMCAAAFLLLEYEERTDVIRQLKTR